MNKDFKNLTDLESVTSVYSYTLPQGDIPLVIVGKKVDRALLRQIDIRSEGGIILTRKDIEDGKDVFALRFLHMQQHSTLIAGKDVLKKLEIQKKHARHALESMFRVTLIDLRELLVQSDVHKDLAEKLALSLARVHSYADLRSKK